MKNKQVNVTLYRWAGRKLFWEIRGECAECDVSLRLIRRLLETEFAGSPVRFEVKNWLDHLFASLLRGGWHPPVVLVNGKLYSQGDVPKVDGLKQRIEQELAEICPRCPICGGLICREDYSAHRRGETRRRILGLIQAQHPEWVSADGICERCLSFYEQNFERSERLI